MAVTKEQLEHFETEHKRIAHVKGKGEPPPWEIVLRKPKASEYKQYRSQSASEGSRDRAQEILVRKLAVYPQGPALDELFEEWPGVAEACTRAVAHLCGLEVEDLGKF